MRKILGILLLAILIISIHNFALAASPEVLSTYGVVKEVEGNSILIEDPLKKDQTVAVLALGTTYVVDNNTMRNISPKTIKKGDYVKAFYGKKMTKSIPPQTVAILLVKGIEESNAEYVRVSTVSKNRNVVKIGYDDKKMNISRKAMKENSALRPGDEVLAWYSLMDKVSPTEFNALRARLLNRDIHNIVLYSLDHGIDVNGRLIAEKYVLFNGKIYLPLRAISEKLGYTVKWNANTRQIDLQKGAASASLQIGSKNYSNGKVRVVLSDVPKIFNGETYVPISFFEDVLDQKVDFR